MSITRRALCTSMALGLTFSPAFAQEPSKQPIRIIVPYPAGGNADSAARAVANLASESLKQTILIDNRPGASSIIGTELVSRAPADGLTIGVVSDSHAINQVMAKNPKAADSPFDLRVDHLWRRLLGRSAVRATRFPTLWQAL
ncbi:Bug family tripartite tricarboxylate transporter substrate binding protein [Variovorax sp. UC74_104]|uniref:Bug family tripartite tricarboxylate transporter substrate binding protein n=1 Tax=Variovorax sp. UC74_104 TaxID=3374555 RepID=UPI00375788EC